jgi:hypothetical protein
MFSAPMYIAIRRSVESGQEFADTGSMGHTEQMVKDHIARETAKLRADFPLVKIAKIKIEEVVE